MDKQIADRFKLFQEETGKYQNLKFSELKFSDLKLSSTESFRFVKGQNKYIKNYINNNPGDVAELGSSLENNCIASYVEPIADTDVIKEICVSFNKDNAKGSRAFYRDYPFVMDRHHIAIIPNPDLIDARYLQKYLDQFLILQNYGWGENVASVEEIKKHTIPIPEYFDENFSSIELQKIIVEFTDYYENKTKEQIQYINNTLNDIEKIDAIFLTLLFKRDNSIASRFNVFCNNNSIDLKFENINFNIKRIKSDNEDELICHTRMGFTPKKISNGDIFMFSVRDLTANKGLYIDNPMTVDKTNEELVLQTISRNSSKFPPIKSGDVLVSFKLTVGTTKIYKSDFPSYCNEAIDILTPHSGINPEYLAYNCMHEYPKYGSYTNNGKTLNDDDKKLIDIRIPFPTENYTSIEVQNILVNFISEYLGKLNNIKSQVLMLRQMFEEYNQIFLQKTFN